MFTYVKAWRPALMAVAALTATLAFAVPASAASTEPAAARSAAAARAAAAAAACHPIAAMDRDEHTGALFAEGFLSCPTSFASEMRVNLWFDNKIVVGRSMACRLSTNCTTSSGSRLPLSGRHRYCSQVVFTFADDTQTVWSCIIQ